VGAKYDDESDLSGFYQTSQNREARISDEKKRLWKFYRKLTGHRKALAEKLVDRAAAQLVMMEDLELYIQENGYTEEYQNGENQSGKKQSSEMQTYLTLSQRYNQTIKQLDDMLPCEPVVKAEAGTLPSFLTAKPVIIR
jgi:hypothetical protein